MTDLLQIVLAHLRGMWHRRWIGLAAAWIAGIVAVTLVYRIPEKFEASARVYVDTESLLRPLLAGLAIQPNVDQQVALISRTLVSRPNVEKLVRMADLDLGVKDEASRQSLIDSVMNTIRMSVSSGNLYIISYRDSKPERAQRVVQSLLTIFIESSLGDKRQDSRSAIKFVDDQIKHYVETLQASENKLKEFKLKYLGMGQGPDYFGRMAALTAQIASSKLELEAAEQSRDAYRKELEGETATFLPDTAPAQTTAGSTEIDGRIGALRRGLDGLLLKYTDEHPDVVATKRLIEQLEAQRSIELEARSKATTGKPAGISAERNPVFQQLRISLADAEAGVASARSKLAGYEAQYAQLKSQAQRVPEIEQEYVQLTRDYDLQKNTYQSLLARREQAGMGMDVQDSGGAQFRVIDPPRVAPEPVAPNRAALLGIALLASLGAGLFASFAAAQTMPIFHDARTLRVMTQRPILGMVSMLHTAALARMRRRKAYLFVGGLGGLLVSFTAVFVFTQFVRHAT